MADTPTYPDNSTSDDTGAHYDDTPATRRPRWKIALIWAIVVGLLLLMVILHLTGTVGRGTGV
jgi:hypothetical protein